MPLDIRLVNMTPDPIEIDDGTGTGGKLELPPGKAVAYPGDIAGADLRKLLKDGDVQIEDEPPEGFIEDEDA